jgi:NADH dehydrogenase
MNGSVAVTGASGYIGRHVAARLHAAGQGIVNLTGHPSRPLGFDAAGRVRTELLDWHHPARLAYALRGVDVLVNTYWVRFERGDVTYATAIANSGRLLAAARTAGVRRIVQVSIANPSRDSPLPYYRGKARVEELVRASGMRWAIVRPTLVYGGGDVLINNIAWTLRHLPVFGIPGDGRYPVQPVFVGDLAHAICELVGNDREVELDAGGPERHTFVELVRLVRWAIGSHALITHLPPALSLAGARLVGAAKGDVLLTGDEVRGLMGGLLAIDASPVGRTSLTQWLVHHADAVGRRYASELDRHYRAAAGHRGRHPRHADCCTSRSKGGVPCVPSIVPAASTSRNRTTRSCSRPPGIMPKRIIQIATRIGSSARW